MEMRGTWKGSNCDERVGGGIWNLEVYVREIRVVLVCDYVMIMGGVG